MKYVFSAKEYPSLSINMNNPKDASVMDINNISSNYVFLL